MGFPIRKCPDQSLFAAPRTLSQRTTSFIASQRQGIHRIPLRHLIVLIDDVHAARSGTARSRIARKDAVLQSEPGLHAVRHDGSPRSGRSAAQTARAGQVSGPLGWGQSGPNTLPLNNDKQHAHQSVPRTNQAANFFFNMNQDEPRANPWKRQHRHVAPDTPDRLKIDLVEPDGIEPTTSCLQSTRSPN